MPCVDFSAIGCFQHRFVEQDADTFNRRVDFSDPCLDFRQFEQRAIVGLRGGEPLFLKRDAPLRRQAGTFGTRLKGSAGRLPRCLLVVVTAAVEAGYDIAFSTFVPSSTPTSTTVPATSKASSIRWAASTRPIKARTIS